MLRLFVPCLVLLLACSKAPDPPPAPATPPPAAPAGLAQLDAAVAVALGDAYERWQQTYSNADTLQVQAEWAAQVGRLALAYEQFIWAAEALAWARDRQPQDFRWHYLLAVAEIGRGNHEDAVASLRATLRLQPTYLPARLHLGERLLERGALAEAATSLGRRQDDEGAALLGLRGRIALARDDHGAAIELLQAALERDPGASRLRYPLGLALRAAGQESAAREALASRGQGAPAIEDPLMAEIATLADSAEVLISRAGELAQAHEYVQAAELYRQALGVRETVLTRLNLAAVLTRSGHADQAEAEYRRVLDAEPDSGAAHFGLGVLLASRGEDLEASRHYRRAIEIRPADLDARFNLANAQRRLGEKAVAAEEFGEVVRRDPARVDAKLALGQVLMELRQWKEAGEALHAALEAHPADARIALQLARLLAAAPLEEVRDGAAALRLAERLFSQERTLPHAEAVAMALAELGRYEDARRLQAELVVLARSQGRRDLVPDLERALNSYMAGRALRLY